MGSTALPLPIISVALSKKPMRTDKANHRLHLKWRDIICFLWKVAFRTLQESCRTGFPPHVHICSQVICPSFVGLFLPLVPRERLQSRKFLQQTRGALREADALKPKASMLQGPNSFWVLEPERQHFGIHSW
jgi:hypothetical protein